MKKLILNEVTEYIEQNIDSFHKKRIQSLNTLKLDTVLSRKNPYLFKAKYVITAEQIVKSALDAHISSNEETIFGDWLEGLAIFINQKVYSGRKSGIPGIDLEFDLDNIRYLLTVKSGPNWGNSRQIKKMRDDFVAAKRTLRTSNSKLHVIAINGCCYGRDNKPDKGEYFKYCGQRFWELISGESELYTSFIEPLSIQAKEANDEFMEAYAHTLNKFTEEFINEFCLEDDSINWKKIIEFNSGMIQQKKPRMRKR